MSNGTIKITTADENDYRAVKRHLNTVKDHTEEVMLNPNQQIELKSEKLYRFVIRGLPPSTTHEEIKRDVEKHGHSIANVANVIKKTTDNGKKIVKQFPLFYVDLIASEDNKKVFEIDLIADFKVTMEMCRQSPY